MEEAVAMAKAMEMSDVQAPCPVVPGLTPTSSEEVITIRIQPEVRQLAVGFSYGNF